MMMNPSETLNFNQLLKLEDILEAYDDDAFNDIELMVFVSEIIANDNVNDTFDGASSQQHPAPVTQRVDVPTVAGEFLRDRPGRPLNATDDAWKMIERKRSERFDHAYCMPQESGPVEVSTTITVDTAKEEQAAPERVVASPATEDCSQPQKTTDILISELLFVDGDDIVAPERQLAAEVSVSTNNFGSALLDTPDIKSEPLSDDEFEFDMGIARASSKKVAVASKKAAKLAGRPRRCPRKCVKREPKLSPLTETVVVDSELCTLIPEDEAQLLQTNGNAEPLECHQGNAMTAVQRSRIKKKTEQQNELKQLALLERLTFGDDAPALLSFYRRLGLREDDYRLEEVAKYWSSHSEKLEEIGLQCSSPVEMMEWLHKDNRTNRRMYKHLSANERRTAKIVADKKSNIKKLVFGKADEELVRSKIKELRRQRGSVLRLSEPCS